ncbi:MAG: chloride channel protein [Ectothiorhodospiraceae bacterium]|nr:chloride channel protein [Ectothiorhodospiraceae bacterium]
MLPRRFSHRTLSSALEWLHLRLSSSDALLLMSLLGLLSGAITGGVILAFRWMIEGGQGLLLPGTGEDFGSLAAHWRLLLPIAGGLVIGLVLTWVGDTGRSTGVAYVMERLHYYQGRLPFRNAVVQFFGAAASIITGHSVGREGPGIHLGAASGSLLGQQLGLPNNALRTLVACGVAAAIAASFNTPLAGVVFAMEVVMMEYTLAAFLPVMLAAVTATVLTQIVYGSSPAFMVPPLNLESLWELPYLLLLGLLIGALAAAFIQSLSWFHTRGTRWPLWVRTTLAGALVGMLALVVPQIMGVGYDTVTSVLMGELGLVLLLAIVAAKLLASTAAIGLGIPGGLIGPTVVIGAAAGGALGHVAQMLTPELASPPALYAMIGLGAMMGATLRAPLAALTAMLELTYNPNIIFPGMLTIAAASLCASEIFGKDSVFLHQLQLRGTRMRYSAVLQSLSRLGIARVMDRSIAVAPRIASREELLELLSPDPRWLLIREPPSGEPQAILAVGDLLQFLELHPAADEVDLMGIPARRLQPAPIELQASLREALDALEQSDAEALYVSHEPAPGFQRYYGIVLRQDVENQHY